MLSIEEIRALGLPIENIDDKVCLYINAALDWLEQNTTLYFDKDDVDSVKSLPSGANLFIISFIEIMSQNSIVASESIAGMSQSFNIKNKDILVSDLASTLLSEYYSNVKSAMYVDKWSTNYECKVEN